jgi:hypothetical protein
LAKAKQHRRSDQGINQAPAQHDLRFLSCVSPPYSALPPFM